MGTTISFTLTQLVGVILASCAGIVTISAAINVLAKLIMRIRQPEKDMGDRIAHLETCLENDNRRLSAIEESFIIDHKCFLALIRHAIDGNDIDQLREAQQEMEDFLINRK